MDLTKKILTATLLFGFIVSCPAFPAPEEDEIDTNDFILFEPIFPKYDPQTLDDHPMTIDITSTVQTSLDSGNKSEVAADLQQKILQALTELGMLASMLESSTQYIDLRKQQDPSWPSTLPAKVSAKSATPAEISLFESDLQHAISGVVIMKMMEERLFLINTGVEQILQENPEVNLKELFGETDTVEVVQALFALKYLEGFLHAANMMIAEAGNDDYQTDFSSVLPSASTSADTIPVFFTVDDVPAEPILDDDLALSMGACVVLFLSTMGLLFIIFMLLYVFFKAIKKCCTMGTTLEKKSKYEQI